MQKIYKYPRTYHLNGSGIQRGDEDLSVIPVRSLAGQHVVIEEKMDGANSAISFSDDGCLLLQSRGHYLSGGPSEKQFALFKTWAYSFFNEMLEGVGQGYLLFGQLF